MAAQMARKKGNTPAATIATPAATIATPSTTAPIQTINGPGPAARSSLTKATVSAQNFRHRATMAAT